MESRHNTLTSDGSVRDIKGLELHVTAASDCRLSIRSVCERQRREGLYKPHTLICGITIMMAYRRARVVK